MKPIFAFKTRHVFALAVLFIQALFIGIAADALCPGSGAYAFFGFGLLSQLAPTLQTAGLAFNQLAVTIFQKEATQMLFPSNSFFEGCTVDKAVLGAKTVQVPQDEDDDVTVHKDPKTFPLPTETGEDSFTEYEGHFYMSNGKLITNLEEIITDYGKLNNKKMKSVKKIGNDLANDILYEWNPSKASQIIRTSGASVAAGAPGATGNRKAVTANDILDAMTAFLNSDHEIEGARMLVSPYHLAQLLKIERFTDYDKRGVSDTVATGALGKLYGFDVFVRSSVVRYTNDATPTKKDWKALAAADDNLPILFYHPDAVRYGKSDVKVVMDDKQQVGYPGLRFHVEATAGATIWRKSQKGVVALVESAV